MRPLIILTNDDGLSAPGIRALQDAVKPLGDLLIVAPDGPRSAQSNAITTILPLRVYKTVDEPGLTVYKCNGTPTDCVKMAINTLAPRRPSLVIAGINHGINTSISVIYSGTMGAALEACVDDIPSFGISLDNYSRNADMTVAARYAHLFARYVLHHPLPRYSCLNINVPDLQQPLGIKVCRQAQGSWHETFDRRTDPAGHSYYWLGGDFVNHEPNVPDTDQTAVEQGYVAVTPVQLDMTDYKLLNTLNNTDFNN